MCHSSSVSSSLTIMTKYAHKFGQRNGKRRSFSSISACSRDVSCILFDCVFQLLLNMVAELTVSNGYKCKDSAVVLHDRSFADDISVMSSCPKLAQKSIDVIVRFRSGTFF